MKNFLLFCIFVIFLSLASYEFYTQSFYIQKNNKTNILAIIKNETKETEFQHKEKIDYSNFEYVEH